MQRSIEPAIWQFDGFLDSGDCRALSALARLPRWAEEKPDGPINHTGYCVEVAVEDQRLLDLEFTPVQRRLLVMSAERRGGWG